MRWIRRNGLKARPTSPDQLVAAARDAGLKQHAEWAATVARPSLRLAPSPVSTGDFGSRLGGSPALPPDFIWPSWDGRPQSFIGQIRLDELGDEAASFGLPATGLLVFFYDSAQSTWGFDPKDAGSSLVSYFPAGTSLTITDSPAAVDSGARFQRLGVSARREWTVPAYGSLELEIGDRGQAYAAGGRTEIDLDALGRFEERLSGQPTAPRHRMFGYADQIQNEMRTECELVMNGIYLGDASFVDDPRTAVLSANFHLWRLLLQVDSDDSIGTMWGDVGRIYYWIREDALAERDFNRTWLILQCH
jgi:uncharacterized protein YwqG